MTIEPVDAKRVMASHELGIAQRDLVQTHKGRRNYRAESMVMA